MNDTVLIIFRSFVTVALFGLFIALIVWAWSPRRKQAFTEAANSVFDETEST